MFDRLKLFFGLSNEAEHLERMRIELKTLKTENRELRDEIKKQQDIIKQQNAILQELSEDNLDIGRTCRRLADTVATQQKLLDIYQAKAGVNYEIKTA